MPFSFDFYPKIFTPASSKIDESMHKPDTVKEP